MFAEKDTDDQDCYLIIQRQFEDPDDDTRYIETHDANTAVISLYAGLEFTPETLLVEFDRPSDNLIRVTFGVAPSKFAGSIKSDKDCQWESLSLNLSDTRVQNSALREALLLSPAVVCAIMSAVGSIAHEQVAC